jgi:hypothetical protein
MLKMGEKMPKNFRAVADPTVAESFWHFFVQIQHLDRPQ